MNAEIVLIVAVILVSVVFVIYLMSRNAKDTNPQLVNQLKKKKDVEEDIT
jgi:cell division protein FtsL